MQIYIANYLKKSYVVGRCKWKKREKKIGNILLWMSLELFHPVIFQVKQPEDV